VTSNHIPTPLRSDLQEVRLWRGQELAREPSLEVLRAGRVLTSWQVEVSGR